MEDLENADGGLMPAPSVPLQEPCATRSDTDSASVGPADHESDFSTLLDGLEEDLGVSRVVDPATVSALPGVLLVVHREVVPPRPGTQGRVGPRFTRRHTAVCPQQVRSFWQMKTH